MVDQSRTLKTIRRFAISGILAIALINVSVAEKTDEEVLKSFADHVAALKIDDDQSELIKKISEDFGDSAADVITESLIVLNPGYAAAIESTDEGDLSAGAQKFDPFISSEDKFLAADASFYLARGYMNEERFEVAITLLAKVNELSDFSVHVGAAQFYTGIAQAGLLQYESAVNTLSEFLQFYPTAPERLRVAAWRQIQQLRSIEDGKMEDIYQRMDYSRRKLSHIEPGEKTQQQQDKIVNMLAKLIKEQEKKEASQSQQKQQQQKNTQQQQQQQQQQSQSQQKSKSQTGGTSNNPNGKVVKKAYNDSPASPWSRLRERSRDPGQQRHQRQVSSPLP